MHHFATPLRPAQQTCTSLRAPQHKRRRHHHDSTDPHDALDRDANGISFPDARSAPLYAPWEREQRRAAGLSSDDAFQIPAPPFPHAAPRDSRANFTSARLHQELASIHPAIYPVDASAEGRQGGSKSGAPALRTTHHNVLATVMHRCLLEGDYHRAARAWGMILRTQAHGTPIEPRYNGLWGLGAELLLRRNAANSISSEGEQDRQLIDEHLFSEQGFRLARDYYERLILQYPIRIYQPHAIDAATFYPPMLSVWIMQVLERSRRARRQRRHAARESSNLSVSFDGDTAMTSEESHTFEAEVQAEELAGAREICQRLDQLVESPPYDKNAQLLALRGHVGLWISDLLLGKATAQEQDDSDYEIERAALQDDADAAEETRKCDESLDQVKQAKEYFNRASQISNRASHEMTVDIQKKVQDIERRKAALRNSGNNVGAWG